MKMTEPKEVEKNWKLTPQGIFKKGQEMGIHKTRWEKTKDFRKRLIELGAK
jgi:hypothetical protein